MPGGYSELRLKLLERIDEMEATVGAASEFPISVANELRYVGRHYIKAERELLNGREKEAAEEIEKAINHVDQASSASVKYRVLVSLRTAHKVRASYSGYEDLAAKYIKNYSEHSKNFLEISNMVENAKFPDEDSPESRATCEENIKKLQAFLEDFEAGGRELFCAIKKEQKATEFEKSHIVVAIIAAIVAILGCVVGLSLAS